MTLALIFIWYVLGLVGSALALEFLYRRNREYPMDIHIDDVCFGCFMALSGPLNFAIGIIIFVTWLLGGLVKTNRVVFRKHTK